MGKCTTLRSDLYPVHQQRMFFQSEWNTVDPDQMASDASDSSEAN